MLKRDRDLKNDIIDILRNQGYATYARLLQLFDVYTTDDPNAIAYMIPGKAAIVLNENALYEDQVSVLVRHEILHEFLTHMERQIEFEKAHPGLKAPKSNNKLANIAADFEISNVGYTDNDKYRIRNIQMGNNYLQGLVTELEEPGWENLTFEEMYEKLLEKNQEEQEQIAQQLQNMSDIDADTLQRISDAIDDLMDQLENEENENEKNQKGGKPKASKSNKKSQGSEDEEEQEGQGEDTVEQDLDKLGKMKDQVDQMKDEVDEIDNTGSKIESKKESRIKKDIEARAKEIAKAIRDIKIKDDLIDETRTQKIKQKMAKAAKDTSRYSGSGLRQFTLNLNRFIKNAVEGGEDYSYAKTNPSYARHGFLMPTLNPMEGPVPSINVYHDVSGSFYDEAKTAAAMQAIATLNKYVRKGELKIDVYYFADTVSSNRNGAGGGTRGTPILDHIEATKPQNVIVITDSDITDCNRVVTVPGAVWMLFYDDMSYNLIDHLKGKKENKAYLINYNRG